MRRDGLPGRQRYLSPGFSIGRFSMGTCEMEQGRPEARQLKDPTAFLWQSMRRPQASAHRV